MLELGQSPGMPFFTIRDLSDFKRIRTVIISVLQMEDLRCRDSTQFDWDGLRELSPLVQMLPNPVKQGVPKIQPTCWSWLVEPHYPASSVGLAQGQSRILSCARSSTHCSWSRNALCMAPVAVSSRQVLPAAQVSEQVLHYDTLLDRSKAGAGPSMHGEGGLCGSSISHARSSICFGTAPHMAPGLGPVLQVVFSLGRLK